MDGGQDSGQDTGIPLVDAARIMGTTPAALRKRLQRGSVPGYKRAGQWFVLVDSVLPTGSPRAGHGQDTAREAVVSPQIVEQAITRTGQQYSADLRAMLGELREVYAGQIAAQAETIAELRRRAEVAEAKVAEVEVARQQEVRAERRKRAVAYEIARQKRLGLRWAVLLLDDEVDQIIAKNDKMEKQEEHPAPLSSPTWWDHLLARFRGT